MRFRGREGLHRLDQAELVAEIAVAEGAQMDGRTHGAMQHGMRRAVKPDQVFGCSSAEPGGSAFASVAMQVTMRRSAPSARPRSATPDATA